MSKCTARKNQNEFQNEFKSRARLGKNTGLNVTPLPANRHVEKLNFKHGFIRSSRPEMKNTAERREISTEEKCAVTSSVSWSDATNSSGSSSGFETVEESYSSSTEKAPSTSEYSEEETLRTGEVDDLAEDGFSLSSICLTPARAQIQKTGFECDGLRTPTNKSIKSRSSMKKPEKRTKFSVEKLGKFKPKPSSLLLAFDDSTIDSTSQSFCEKAPCDLLRTSVKRHRKAVQSTSTPMSEKNTSLKRDLGLSAIPFDNDGSSCNGLNAVRCSYVQKKKKEDCIPTSLYAPCPLVSVVGLPPRPGVMIVSKYDVEKFVRRK